MIFGYKFFLSFSEILRKFEVFKLIWLLSLLNKNNLILKEHLALALFDAKGHVLEGIILNFSNSLLFFQNI